MLLKGYIEDLDSFVASKSMMIMPLHYGAGLKGKVVSSMISAFRGLARELLLNAWLEKDFPMLNLKRKLPLNLQSV